MTAVGASTSQLAPDRRRALALGLAIAAVIVSAAAAALWWSVILGTTSGAADPDLAIVVFLLGTGLAPLLAVASGGIVLRMRGTLSRGRLALVVALAATALPLAALAAASWGLGFADADAGRTPTGFAAATPLLLLGSLAAGALLIGVLVHALCRAGGLGQTGSVLLALLCGALGGPVVGWSLATPMTSAALAVAALVLVALGSPGAQRAPNIRTPAAARPAVDRRSREGLALALARLAAIAGLLGAVFALSGSTWWPVPIDSTTAMSVGISILLAACMPLLASVALLVEARFPVAALLVRGPATALALALVAMGYWYTSAPDGDANWWAVSVASLFVGVAVGATSFLLPVSRPVAIVAGLAVALALAATQVAALLPALAFGVPLVALSIVILGRRGERRGAAASEREATAEAR